MEVLLLLVIFLAVAVPLWYLLKLLYVIVKTVFTLIWCGIKGLWCYVRKPKTQQIQEPIYTEATESIVFPKTSVANTQSYSHNTVYAEVISSVSMAAYTQQKSPIITPPPAEPTPAPNTPPPPTPRKKYMLEELISWENEGDMWHCVFTPPIDSNVEYLFCRVSDSFSPDILVEKGELKGIEIIGTDNYNFTDSNIFGKRIDIPQRGILTSEMKGSFFASYQILPNGCIVTINTNPDVIAEYIAQQERKAEERRRIALEKEKAEIAAKIKEKHRRHQLEKLVRQELIDSGELFGEQHKRPQIPREVVDAVYRRDGGRCVYCGATENLHLDHIIPFSRGGATSVENLQLLCQKCNLEKSNKIG
jgi:hypothetical protein